MVEKYLKKSISRPQIYVDRLLEANLLPWTPTKSSPINTSSKRVTSENKTNSVKNE
jgi:hypothetical protein